MSTATRLSAYGLALAVIAGGAWGLGAAVGPLAEDDGPAGAGHAMSEPAPVAGSSGELPGLAASAGGYRLELGQDRLVTGGSQPFRFRVLGPDGTAVTRFSVEHDKLLHLVVVRRDGVHYQHLHPELATDGTWTTTLVPPAAGSYRVFADFTPEGGAKTVLGADVHAAGDFQPRTESPQRTSIVDGYEVRLSGDLVAGTASTVAATITRDGKPVTDLQPYLGAYGHLVTLRAADLGYLHVHPIGEPGDGTTTPGPDIRFAVEVPTAGRYRLFLDFQHQGTVRTAEFTVDTSGTSAPATPADGDSHGHGHGG